MIDPRAKGNLKIYDEKIIKEINLLHWKVFTKSKRKQQKRNKGTQLQERHEKQETEK